MGSSFPAFWDGQSSRRKEISRLSERKRKTIAFLLALVFFVVITMNSRIQSFLTSFLLGLCLAALLALTFGSAIGPFAFGAFDGEREIEPNDDLLLLNTLTVKFLEPDFFKMDIPNLSYSSAQIIPNFPPPKSA